MIWNQDGIKVLDTKCPGHCSELWWHPGCRSVGQKSYQTDVRLGRESTPKPQLAPVLITKPGKALLFTTNVDLRLQYFSLLFSVITPPAGWTTESLRWTHVWPHGNSIHLSSLIMKPVVQKCSPQMSTYWNLSFPPVVITFTMETQLQLHDMPCLETPRKIPVFKLVGNNQDWGVAPKRSYKVLNHRGLAGRNVRSPFLLS